MEGDLNVTCGQIFLVFSALFPLVFKSSAWNRHVPKGGVGSILSSVWRGEGWRWGEGWKGRSHFQTTSWFFFRIYVCRTWQQSLGLFCEPLRATACDWLRFDICACL